MRIGFDQKLDMVAGPDQGWAWCAECQALIQAPHRYKLDPSEYCGCVQAGISCNDCPPSPWFCLPCRDNWRRDDAA